MIVLRDQRFTAIVFTEPQCCGSSATMATIPSRPGRAPRWRRKLALLARSRRLVAMVEISTLLIMLAMTALTWFALGHWTSPERPLSPPFVALLLVANL